MNAKLNLVLVALLCVSCLSRSRINEPGTTKGKQGARRSVKASTDHRKPHYFLADTDNSEADKIDGSQLQVHQATLVRMQISKLISCKLTYGIDPEADSAEWQVCSLDQSSLPCKKGVSNSNEIFFGTLTEGRSEIAIRACAERVLKPEEKCGEWTVLKWTQPRYEDLAAKALVDELASKEADLSEFGNKIFQTLEQYKREISGCATDPAERARINEEVHIALENLLAVGTMIVVNGLPGAELGQPAALAEATAEALPPSKEDGSASEVDSDTDKFKPEGLSLAGSSGADKLRAFFARSKASHLNSNERTFSSRDVLARIRGSSGLYTPDGKIDQSLLDPAYFKTLDPRRQAFLVSGILAGAFSGQLTPDEEKEFAVYAALTGLLQPDAGPMELGLAGSGDACTLAADNFKASLSALTKAINPIKDRVIELKKTLEIKKASDAGL